MNWAKLRATTLLPCMLLALGASACDEPGVGLDDRAQVVRETGTTVRVLLTDAPADYIGSAWVDIGVVELVPTDGGPHVVLSEDGTDGFVDLLELQNAATTPIAEADIEPGSFSQLRLVIEAARVELAEGYEFRDGSTEMELFVPSGAQTGIKLNLHSGEDDGPLEIIPGETVLVLDFDVSRSYVLRGNPETPAGIHGVNFKPTLRVTAFDVAASISGTVSTTLGGVSVGGLMVTATPVDEGTVVGYQTEAGTTTTAGDGTYTIHFLVPGTYEVMVDLDPGLGTVPESNLVELDHSEDETGVDFEIIDVTGSIAGTATTEVDGASVAELVVTATPADETLETLETSTAADGTYLFESVVPGLYTVTIEPGEDLLAEPESQDVEVGNSEDVTGIDFELVEDLTGTISGTVTTAISGVSVEGLVVTATPIDPSLDPVTATTDSDGDYTIESVPAGSYTVTVAVGTGFATDPAARPVVLDEDENETGVDFAVVEAGS